MSTKFDDFLNEQLNDVEIRSEYEALQQEHALIQAMIDARQEFGITQDVSEDDLSNMVEAKN
jgi:XRE family transcriptional regulator